jgi:hypothetical protein
MGIAFSRPVIHEQGNTSARLDSMPHEITMQIFEHVLDGAKQPDWHSANNLGKVDKKHYDAFVKTEKSFLPTFAEENLQAVADYDPRVAINNMIAEFSSDMQNALSVFAANLRSSMPGSKAKREAASALLPMIDIYKTILSPTNLELSGTRSYASKDQISDYIREYKLFLKNISKIDLNSVPTDKLQKIKRTANTFSELFSPAPRPPQNVLNELFRLNKNISALLLQSPRDNYQFNSYFHTLPVVDNDSYVASQKIDLFNSSFDGLKKMNENIATFIE